MSAFAEFTAYLVPITAASFNGIVTRILIKLHTRNHLVTLCQGDLSRLKVYKKSLSYAEGKPLTLCNHFIQFYTLSSLTLLIVVKYVVTLILDHETHYYLMCPYTTIIRYTT